MGNGQFLLGRELQRFLAVGIANTAMCYSVYLLALVALSRDIAYTVAFLFGVGFTALANVRFAFDRKLTLKSVAVYTIYYCAYWLVSLGMLKIVVESLSVPEVIGPAAVLPLSVPLHYLFSRRILRRFDRASSNQAHVCPGAGQNCNLAGSDHAQGCQLKRDPI
jgi:putative flippase GtrA